MAILPTGCAKLLSFHWRRSVLLSLILLINIASIIQTDAKKPKIKSPAQKKRESVDHGKGFRFVLYAFLVAIVPTILMFIWSIIKDPETPTVAKNLGTTVKDNLFGYLSSNNKKKVKTEVDDE